MDFTGIPNKSPCNYLKLPEDYLADNISTLKDAKILPQNLSDIGIKNWKEKNLRIRHQELNPE